MSVKPSAITGTGVENDPYVIHNYDELKWCCEDSDAIPSGQAATDYTYVILNNNIDCTTYGMSFRWSITCYHDINFNLNSKTIENFYIKPRSYMFATTAAGKRLSIHDGKILNIYGDWISKSTAVLDAINATGSEMLFKNVSLSVDLTNFTNTGSCLCATAPKNLTMTNCTLDVQGTNLGHLSAIVAGARLFTCDIHMNISCSGYVFYILSGVSANGYALNCRFMGQIRLNTMSTSSCFIYYTTVRNCVFDVQTILTSPTSSVASFVYGGGSSDLNYGIYNTEKLPNSSFNGTTYIACTSAEMDMRLNPNADVTLQGKGFDVIKG